MSCGNPYKHKIQNTIHFFLDTFSGRNSNSRALTDNQMECMQFGICSFIPKNQKKFFIFITNQEKKMKIKKPLTLPQKYFNEFQNYYHNADEKLVSYSYIPEYLKKTTKTNLLVNSELDKMSLQGV